MSTAIIEREAPAVTSQNLLSVEAEEPLDKRQKYKVKILEEHYQAEIAATLARRLAWVKAGKDQLTIGLQDANGKEVGRLIDHGDRITAGSGTEEEIQAMIDLARAKGWKNMKFTGSDEFVKRASQSAVDAGFEIKGFKPTPKSEPEPEQNIMDVLAELTGEAAPDIHEQARLEARQRVQAALDKPRVGQREIQAIKTVQKAIAEPLQVPQSISDDPYMLICRAERQRVLIEIEKTKAELSKTKTHDLAAVQKATLAEAQNDARNAHILQPVRDAHARRTEAELKLKQEKDLHAGRSWLGKTINASSMLKLEGAAAFAKSEHLAIVKVVKQKLMNSEGARRAVGYAAGDNEQHATLTARLERLEREAQDLKKFEVQIERSDEGSKKLFKYVSLGLTIDRVLDIVRNNEKAKRSADQLVEELARQERQRELAKVQELEEPTAEQHQTPRPR